MLIGCCWGAAVAAVCTHVEGGAGATDAVNGGMGRLGVCVLGPDAGAEDTDLTYGVTHSICHDVSIE